MLAFKEVKGSVGLVFLATVDDPRKCGGGQVLHVALPRKVRRPTRLDKFEDDEEEEVYKVKLEVFTKRKTLDPLLSLINE